MLGQTERVAGASRRRGLLAAMALPRRAVLAGIIIAELLVVYVLLNGGSWVYDDNLITILAGKAGLTWSWLTSPIFQHWGIGYHFVFSGLHKLMPIDYRWALVGMLALLGASMYLIDRIVTLLFGGRWMGLLAASYLGFSILFSRQLQWFASGLQAVPTTFFDLLCLYAYLRYVLEENSGWIGLSAGALAVGLLFYEKPAYMLLYLFLLRALFVSSDLRPAALARVLWKERVLWGSLLAITVVWGIGYLHYAGSAAIGGQSVSVSAYLRFFRIMWLQTLAPALAGFTLPQTGLSAAQIAAAAGLQVLIVLAIAISLRQKPSAWRAWAFLAVALVVNGLLVARARVPLFGPGVAGDLRYLTDFSWLVPLSVCFAFGTRRVVRPRHWERPTDIKAVDLLRPAAGFAALALAAYLALSLITTAKLQRQWPGEAARTWQANVRSGLARTSAEQGTFVVADEPSPPYIVPAAFSPDDLLSSVLPLYSPGSRVDGVLVGPLALVDPVGGVHRAAVARAFGSSSVPTLRAAHQLTVPHAARVISQTSGMCVTAGSRPAAIIRSGIAAPASADLPYYLMVTYSARQAGVIPLFIDSGHGFPGWAESLHMTRGPGASILFIDSPSVRRLRLELPRGETVCLSRLSVVTLRAIS